MKKVITHSICMLVMITSIATSFAGTISPLEINSMEITLTLNNVKAGQLLSIKDINGITLYRKMIEEEGLFSSRYDLSAIPDGNYFFEHEKDYQIKIIPFKVANNKVNFDKSGEKIIFKPVVSIKDNKVYVSKLDLEKETLEIEIYHDDRNKSGYNLMYSENIENSIKTERIYRLPISHLGKYKVVISANGRQYIEYFSI
ncbi:hypothetical protein ACJOV8_005755 [Formosa sp. 3Alg 14/1]|uniref:hypothetical protein n=1 Tax=Formosa sp. 3Alg 14/1 TaxID=3382190 RepID=UPI0039BE4D4A